MSDLLSRIVSAHPKLSVSPIHVTLGKESFHSSFGWFHYARLATFPDLVIARRFCLEKDPSFQTVESFCCEVEFLLSLNHPFLSRIVGFTNRPPLFIFLQFPSGKSLFNVLHDKSANENLPNSAKNGIMAGIAAAMVYLQSKHGFADLSPGNVVLSGENKMPVIVCYGSRRKKVCKVPNMWTPPELMNRAEIGVKTDVYSFGIMVWEMYTQHLPFPNIKTEQFASQVGINNERPMIPFEMPNLLKRLAQLCWDKEPEKRPSFQKIYDLFVSGMVSFDNIAVKEEGLSNPSVEAVELIVNNWNSQNKNKIVESKSDVDVFALFNSMIPNEILEYTSALTETNCIHFFEGVNQTVQLITSKETKCTALFEILKLISSNKKCMEIYINSNQIKKLPFFVQDLTEISLSILIPIFSSYPETATPDLLQTLDSLISLYPLKVCRLFSALCSNQLSIQLYGSIVDLLITRAHLFIKGEATLPLIHILYKLLTTVPAIKENRSKYIFKIFYDCLLSTSNDSLIATYSALIQLKPPIISVDPLLLCRHIEDHAIKRMAIQALCHSRPEKVNIKLIELLLKEVKRARIALFAILSLAKYNDFAQVILECFELWLNKDDDIELPLKLIMVLLQHNQNFVLFVTNLPGLPSFLNKTLETKSIEILDILCLIIRKFEVTPQFVQNLADSGFISNYLKIGVESNNEDIHTRCYYLIDYLCRIKFVSDFMIFLPAVIYHLKNVPKFRNYCMAYCSVVSQNQEGLQALIQNGVSQLINNPPA